MGTRGIVGFVSGGQEKLTYNHSDSYPSGLGVAVLEWAKSKITTTKDGFAYLSSDVEHQVSELELVREDDPPTAEQFDRIKRFYNGNVDRRPDGVLTWYQALRETQGDLRAVLDSGFMIDSRNFALDSLFCEWGYVMDLDEEKLDVYVGFQKEVPTEGRWAGVANMEQPTYGSIYHPIQRIWSIPFSEISAMDPETFVMTAEKLAGEGDELA